MILFIPFPSGALSNQQKPTIAKKINRENIASFKLSLNPRIPKSIQLVRRGRVLPATARAAALDFIAASLLILRGEGEGACIVALVVIVSAAPKLGISLVVVRHGPCLGGDIDAQTWEVLRLGGISEECAHCRDGRRDDGAYDLGKAPENEWCSVICHGDRMLVVDLQHSLLYGGGSHR